MSDGEVFASFIWLGLFVTILIATFVFAFFLLPIVLIAGAIFAGAYYHYQSPKYKEQKAKEHTHALYQSAKAAYGVEPDLFTYVVGNALPGSLPESVRDELFAIADELTDLEGFHELPPPPAICNSMEGARYRDYIASLSTKGRITEARQGAEVLADALYSFAERIPESDGPFTVRFGDLVPTTPEQVQDFIEHFYQEPVKRSGIFSELRHRFDANLEEVKVLPTKYKGDDYIHQYFMHTPFLRLFDIRVPFGIPEDTRFEHHWIVSPPGTGKSTTLQCLIDHDFDRVARGEASVVVMESNRDLIKAIEGLDRFGSGGDLDGRLVLIDCEDVEYPIALNLFDVGLNELNASPREREALFNSAISMLDYVFRALLGAELTSRQSTLFNFSIQLLLQVPGATLDTLIDLMSVKQRDFESYAEHLTRVDSDTRKFFELKFFSHEFDQTKAQVVDRLFAIKRIRTLSRMFSAERTKLDLYSEMGQGKVILINCAKSLLQEEGVEIVSRFFLAMILLAAEKRQLLPQSERLPTYVYIDECQDVIRRDEKLPIILDQARKFRVAMTLAHQRLDQLQPFVLSALMGSTAIKFAAKLSDHSLARNMNTASDFIRDQPNYSYAAYIRGVTKSAVSLSIPHFNMHTMPRISPEAHKDIINIMRAKYARVVVKDEQEPPPEEPVDTDDQQSEIIPSDRL